MTGAVCELEWIPVGEHWLRVAKLPDGRLIAHAIVFTERGLDVSPLSGEPADESFGRAALRIMRRGGSLARCYIAAATLLGECP